MRVVDVVESDPIRSHTVSRKELVDTIGRLRAAVLVDLPTLPKDRQSIVRSLLDSTYIRTDEPHHQTVVEAGYVAGGSDEDGVVTITTTAINGDKLVVRLEGASVELFEGLQVVLRAVSGGAVVRSEQCVI